MEIVLKVDKMLKLMEKYGILKVRHHIPLKKNLERLEDLMKLSEKIPLVMRHKDFYMERARKKLWWLDSYQQINR